MGSNCDEMLMKFNNTQQECSVYLLEKETAMTGFEQVPFIQFGEVEEVPFKHTVTTFTHDTADTVYGLPSTISCTDMSNYDKVKCSFAADLDLISIEKHAITDPGIPMSLKNDKTTEQVNFLMKLLEKKKRLPDFK